MNDLYKKFHVFKHSFKSQEVKKYLNNQVFLRKKKMFANNNNSSINKGIIRSLNNDMVILLISLAVMMAIGKYLF